MNEQNYREQFNIKSKRIYLPSDLTKMRQKDLASYQGQLSQLVSKLENSEHLSFESFEMIHSCESYNTEELVQIYSYWFWFNTFYNSGVAREYIRNSSKPPVDQAMDFFNNLNNMPFFKKMMEENESCARATVANEESVIFVNNMRDLNWLHKAQGRGAELMEIYKNQKKVIEELRQLYPKYNTDHFTKSDQLQMSSLMSSFATI